MSLQKLSYSEYDEDPRSWRLAECDFIEINLIVGRNATGKSRLISVIGGLCKVLSGPDSSLFDSGTYNVELLLGGKIYQLCLQFNKGNVVKETLFVDGIERLSRDSQGKGSIYYEKEDNFINFELPPSALAIRQRRDALQHSFIVALYEWASGCQTYLFGSHFGKDVLYGLASFQTNMQNQTHPADSPDLVFPYSKAFIDHQDPFDHAIIRDMTRLGFPLKAVGVTDMRQLMPGLKIPEAVLGIYVIEADRDIQLPQGMMSQGMFRALALVIHINIAAFNKKHTLVLVDDIGEGLDYERSACLIDVLMEHAQAANIQLIMTSNDRFAMNRVPLKHWSLLRRNGSVVRAYTERNSAKEFADFKLIGLSNFDFFTSAAF